MADPTTPNNGSGSTSPDNNNGSNSQDNQGKQSQSTILRDSVGLIQREILDNNYKILLLQQIWAKNPTGANYDAYKKACDDSVNLNNQLYSTSIDLNMAITDELNQMYTNRDKQIIADQTAYYKKIGELSNDPEALTKYVDSYIKDQNQKNLDFYNELNSYNLNTYQQTYDLNKKYQTEALDLDQYYSVAVQKIWLGQITSESDLNQELFGDPTMVSNVTIDGKDVSLLAPMSVSDTKDLTVDANGIVHDANGNVIAATVSTQTDGKTSESITVAPIKGKLDDNNYLLTKITPTSNTVVEKINSITITKDITADNPTTISVQGTPGTDTITVGGVNANMNANYLDNATFTSIEKLVVAQSTTMQASTVPDFSDGIVINPGVILNLINFSSVADLSKISGSELDSNIQADANVTLSQASDRVIITTSKLDLESFDKVHDKLHFTNKTTQAVQGTLALESADDKSTFAATDKEAPKVNIKIDAKGVATSSDISSAAALADAIYNAGNFAGIVMVKDGTLGAYIVSKSAAPAGPSTFAASDKEASDASLVHIIGVDPNNFTLSDIIY